ncbi:MAG: hypothetical protein NVSMB2_16740 [Chloroflexota bacterium]
MPRTLVIAVTRIAQIVASSLSGLAVLCVSFACSGPGPSPTPEAAVATQVSAPSAQPASAPSPSASVGVPSPIASPSPFVAAAAAPTPIALDAYPFAVMIDNIADARPQFGLASADVIYEAPAEAGIPRLMPIYLSAGGQADSIGPVRSARHYFVQIANEYRTPLVHIGASPQGFDTLRSTGLPDVDEARGDAGFRRDPHRFAPHNAFVSTTSIRDVLQQRGGPSKVTPGPLSFGDYRAGPQAATAISIPYPGPEGYSVDYEYDAERSVYRRVMDGLPHRDGMTGDQYTATSIIVQYADVELIPNDTAGRVDVTLVGSGKGTLIAQGTQVPLTWSRASVREATQFKRSDGAPFLLPTGQVWIQVVPLETQVSIAS